MPGKLWYQRLKFDNKLVVATIFGLLVVQFISLPLFIDLPMRYYLSFDALTVYVGIVTALLLIFYSSRLMRKVRETLEDLKTDGVISKEACDDIIRKTNMKICGRKEKYLPLLFAMVISIIMIYDRLSRGIFGVFDFTEVNGNVIYISNFPFTLIHDTIIVARVTILITLFLSTLILAWEVSRSINLIGEHVEIRIASSGGTGGLSPIGKLMAEVVLLVVALLTVWAILWATYFMITGMLHYAIGVVVILGYTLIAALILPPFVAIHKVMAERKREALNQITPKIEKLRSQVTLGNVSGVSPEMIALSSLLVMLGEVKSMHTIPFDAPLARKVTILIWTPLLACLSVFLETYVGNPFGYLALVAIGILSIMSQLPSK